MRIINRQDIDIEMMDENSLNGAQNVGVGQNRVNNSTGEKISEDGNGNGNIQNVPPQYTIPGILHFIEHEWQRFQAERSQWDTDRAELQVSFHSIKHSKSIKLIAKFSKKDKTLLFFLSHPSSFTIKGREHFTLSCSVVVSV